MNETIESVSQWADETFGPTTPKKALMRAFEEIDELSEAHSHPDRTIASMVEEAADVCITLYRYIYLVDKEAINKKMAINRKRVWKLNGDGTAQHVSPQEHQENVRRLGEQYRETLQKNHEWNVANAFSKDERETNP